MTARNVILLAVLVAGATGVAVRGQYPLQTDPLIPTAPQQQPVAVPLLPQFGGGPLTPAPAACPAPGASVDRLLQISDGAGIDEMLRQLAAVRAKRDEIDRFEKHLVARLQERVKQQSDQLKQMGVAPTAPAKPPMPAAPPTEAAPVPAPAGK